MFYLVLKEFPLDVQTSVSQTGTGTFSTENNLIDNFSKNIDISESDLNK